MDRRTFITGAGTIGSVGALAAATAMRETNAAKARRSGLAQAAAPRSVNAATSAARATATVAALTLGYLPGSAGMFATESDERARADRFGSLRWTRWDPSLVAATTHSAAHSLFWTSRDVDVSLGALHRPETAQAGITSLAITAHYAIDEAPYFVPFIAWRYEAATSLGHERRTQPLTLTAGMPDRVALEVTYVLQPAAAGVGVAASGSLYLPIGTSAQTQSGLATGLYVLAAPSPGGALPDLSAYEFSGDTHAPLAAAGGQPIDFEYITLAVRPTSL